MGIIANLSAYLDSVIDYQLVSILSIAIRFILPTISAIGVFSPLWNKILRNFPAVPRASHKEDYQNQSPIYFFFVKLRLKITMILSIIVIVISACILIVTLVFQSNERYLLQNIPSMGQTKRIYFGQISNNLPNGFGKEFKNERICYVGNFDFGAYEGNGTQYIYVNNQPKIQYKGEFEENSYCGSGTYYEYDSNGQVTYEYDGGWYSGIKMGYGVEARYENGKIVSSYAGTFFNGSRTGFCVWQYIPKGDFELDYVVYVGEIDNSNFTGEGVFYLPDGSIYKEGVFDDGILVEPSNAHERWVFPDDCIWN